MMFLLHLIKILWRKIKIKFYRNYLIKNYTNVKFNTKEIFNHKLSNLTISNPNKIQEQASRNMFSNLIYQNFYNV